MSDDVIIMATMIDGSKFLSLLTYHDKNSSGDEIANVNFYAVRPQATRIR